MKLENKNVLVFFQKTPNRKVVIFVCGSPNSSQMVSDGSPMLQGPGVTGDVSRILVIPTVRYKNDLDPLPL